jgi:acylphosphatase
MLLYFSHMKTLSFITTDAVPRRACVLITGRVQGVGFRDFVCSAARCHHCVGFVRNSRDRKAVEIVAEGRERDLVALFAVIEVGPPAARVDRAIVTWDNATDEFNSFNIRF